MLDSETALPPYFDLNSMLAGVFASWIILSPVMTKASNCFCLFFSPATAAVGKLEVE